MFHGGHHVFIVPASPVAMNGCGKVESVGAGSAGVWRDDNVTGACCYLVNWVERVEERAVGSAVDVEQQRVFLRKIEIGWEPDSCFDLESVSLHREFFKRRYLVIVEESQVEVGDVADVS